MGSFSIACGISGMTITSGEKVALVPLVKNKYHHSTPTGTQFLGMGEFYNPLTLPIFGEYDDYGGIQEIENNVNTQCIEKWCGFKIEDFCELLNDGRGNSLTDSYSALYKLFNKHPGLLEYNMILDDKLLTSLGFVSDLTGFTHLHLPQIYVVLTPNEVVILNAHDRTRKLNQFKLDYNGIKDFLSYCEEKHNYFLNIDHEQQEKIKFYQGLAGMWVKRDIYDYFAYTRVKQVLKEHYFAPEYLKMIGFEFSHTEKSIDRYNAIYKYPGVENYVLGSDGTWSNLYQVKDGQYEDYNETFISNFNDLKKIWQKFTQVDLDLSNLKNLSPYMKGINKFLEDRKTSTSLVGLASTSYLFQTIYLRDFAPCFGESEHFLKLYGEQVENLTEPIIAFNEVASKMYSTNKFFFPTMNGEQYGNDDEQLKLYEKSAAILKKRIKENAER